MKLRCAQCGGEFPLQVESPFARCPFCSSHLYLAHAASFKHLGLPPRVGRAAALDLLRAEASRRDIPSIGSSEVRSLVLPFWSVRGESIQETLPAFSPVPFALASFRLPAAQASWFSAADYPESEVVEPSEESGAGLAAARGGAGSALYSVPFFRVRYGGREKPYEAWVDATGSRVYWGASPPAGGSKASRTFLLSCGGLVVLFALEAALIPGFGPSALAVGVTAGVAYPWLRNALGPSG